MARNFMSMPAGHVKYHTDAQSVSYLRFSFASTLEPFYISSHLWLSPQQHPTWCSVLSYMESLAAKVTAAYKHTASSLLILAYIKIETPELKIDKQNSSKSSGTLKKETPAFETSTWP